MTDLPTSLFFFTAENWSAPCLLDHRPPQDSPRRSVLSAAWICAVSDRKEVFHTQGKEEEASGWGRGGPEHRTFCFWISDTEISNSKNRCYTEKTVVHSATTLSLAFVWSQKLRIPECNLEIRFTCWKLQQWAWGKVAGGLGRKGASPPDQEGASPLAMFYLLSLGTHPGSLSSRRDSCVSNQLVPSS